jgi:hypothetical protein
MSKQATMTKCADEIRAGITAMAGDAHMSECRVYAGRADGRVYVWLPQHGWSADLVRRARYEAAAIAARHGLYPDASQIGLYVSP